MIKKIFAFFGYTLVNTIAYEKLGSDIKDLNNKVIKLEKDLSDKVSLFCEPEIEPTESYSDFKKTLTEDDKKFSPWSLYWKKYYNNHYLCFYLRQISLSPDFISNFLYKFSTYNWGEIEKYMKKVNWTWNDNKSTPTVKELQKGVMSLIFSAIKSIQSGKNETEIQSGGFSVKIKDNDLFIYFDKSSRIF